MFSTQEWESAEAESCRKLRGLVTSWAFGALSPASASGKVSLSGVDRRCSAQDEAAVADHRGVNPESPVLLSLGFL